MESDQKGEKIFNLAYYCLLDKIDPCWDIFGSPEFIQNSGYSELDVQPIFYAIDPKLMKSFGHHAVILEK
ncbi:hypothetical protein [Solidesulfovibrio magneticus]|uniref:Uncharacterized protein n=1 Tax=Solidesulfovibrio magneticus (strain ATCC 700980 / DSM 13731 / RS-1) TaxID=573370 RepID=C4XHP4_SOLM1|nr:hypothetical protein [Solidesulfovibrio magneticus]BAH76418.1 hypothetical protein DMR_29270 [Solidesulfovibrio magneticus RS-1]